MTIFLSFWAQHWSIVNKCNKQHHERSSLVNCRTKKPTSYGLKKYSQNYPDHHNGSILSMVRSTPSPMFILRNLESPLTRKRFLGLGLDKCVGHLRVEVLQQEEEVSRPQLVVPKQLFVDGSRSQRHLKMTSMTSTASAEA